MLLSVDTETTGTDAFHGCKPYLVTCCDGEYNYVFQGKVNPKTREVTWDLLELQLLQELLDSHTLIFHNLNFDRRMLESIDIKINSECHDTLVIAHLLCSGDVHGLKDLAIKYYQYWDDDELELQISINSLRDTYRNHPDFTIATAGHPHFPAITTAKFWKQDLWLDMPLCIKYGVKDAERTYLLYKAFYVGLQYECLLDQYQFRMAMLPVLYDMQTYGIGIYLNKVDKLLAHLAFQINTIIQKIQVLSNFPSKFDPDSVSDMQHLLFHILKLEPVKYTDTGLPSTDADSLDKLLDQSSTHPESKTILQYLRIWREISTEHAYITSYKLWSLPDADNPFIRNNTDLCSTSISKTNTNSKSELLPISDIDSTPTVFYRFHSAINLTGTHWTRQSSSDPNQQNLKKSLSYLFGPPKGYYWLSADLSNIELRIWAYEVGSKQLITEFEKGESVHMIIARAIRPHQIAAYGTEELWQKADPIHGQYTATKGGTFARIYGGSVAKANRTYGIENACAIIDQKIPEVGSYFKHLNNTMWKLEQEFGYPRIYTIQGYPLEVPINKPYSVPSARIQGSASLIMQDIMRVIVQSPIYNYGPIYDIFILNEGAPLTNYPTSKHAPNFRYYHHPLKTSSPNPFCKLIQQVHDSVTFEIPVHNEMDTTNALLLQEMEAVGKRHIPTCPLKATIIHYNAEESIEFNMYSELPIVDDGHTITLHYKDQQWIARVDEKHNFTAPTKQQAIELAQT